MSEVLEAIGAVTLCSFLLVIVMLAGKGIICWIDHSDRTTQPKKEAGE